MMTTIAFCVELRQYVMPKITSPCSGERTAKSILNSLLNLLMTWAGKVCLNTTSLRWAITITTLIAAAPACDYDQKNDKSDDIINCL